MTEPGTYVTTKDVSDMLNQTQHHLEMFMLATRDHPEDDRIELRVVLETLDTYGKELFQKQIFIGG